MPIVKALVLGALSVAWGDPAPRPGGARRVLVYTHSAGFEHDVVKRPAPGAGSVVEKALVELGRTSGAFEALATDDPREFDPERLAQYALVFLYTTGELPLDSRRRDALLRFVEDGGALAGAHSATDTFYAWPAYGELIGAYFDGHPWHERVRVRVEDLLHPATRALGASFEITDEIYQFKAPYDRTKLHVLLSLDVAGLDLAREGIRRADRDFALAWTKEVGRGRVFYTALGHRPEVWRDERFLAHVLGGFRWALGDATSVPLKPIEEEYRRHALETAGDAARGFQVFRRESGPMCARCHAVNGAGPSVGPDLSGVARARTKARILESILAPSATIEPGYESVSLELQDGTLVFGRVVSEAGDTLTVTDTNAVARTIARREVGRRVASRTSVMPEGLASTLTKAEFADLVAYVMTLKVPAPK